MRELQKTLIKSHTFLGKGLHSGKEVTMTIHPAPVNTGVLIRRETEEGIVEFPANSDYVVKSERNTTLSFEKARALTIEHILATFVGLGVDNAIIELSSEEAPIMDGSSRSFAEEISKAGLQEQDEERYYYKPTQELYHKDEHTGSEIRIIPADTFSVEVRIDFNSKILGVQEAYYNEETDFKEEIAPCRTFVFFHELKYLFQNNLIRGGDAENAIVVIENPVPQQELDEMTSLFNVEKLERLSEGYLNNLVLRYPNECARHKLLDVLGDLALAGFRIKAKVIAYKPGHQLNTCMAGMLREAQKNMNNE